MTWIPMLHNIQWLGVINLPVIIQQRLRVCMYICMYDVHRCEKEERALDVLRKKCVLTRNKHDFFTYSYIHLYIYCWSALSKMTFFSFGFPFSLSNISSIVACFTARGSLLCFCWLQLNFAAQQSAAQHRSLNSRFVWCDCNVCLT